MKDMLPAIKASLSQRTNIVKIVAGLCIFAFAYTYLNYTLILFKVYYRWTAAGDIENALRNSFGYLLQALVLLIFFVTSSKKILVTVTTFVAGSAFTNKAYEQILGGYIDSDVMRWLLTEARQFGSAFHEFLVPFFIAGAKVAMVIIMFLIVRSILRPLFFAGKSNSTGFVKALSVVLTMIFVSGEVLLASGLPQANETSAYSLAIHSLFETYPLRTKVNIAPTESPNVVNKIVWVVDESTTAKGADLTLSAWAKQHEAIDFKEVASMGNCSAPSNAALRWGVDVQHITGKTDPRITPTIWGYAKRANFHTTLIDGQVSGAPQNMVWPPERSLIDDFFPEKAGVNTDRSIAAQVNKLLLRPGRDFVYVVLRGAHYSYEGNYPVGTIPTDSPLLAKYLAAISYSKYGFFDMLFNGVDRENVAVFYTSDHGQRLSVGGVPHCTNVPSADEFSVPLFAFLPKYTRANLFDEKTNADLNGRSHSQIFPTSLFLMGYPQDFAETNYDRLLNKPAYRYIWFGRSLSPSASTGLIEVHASEKFPMR